MAWRPRFEGLEFNHIWKENKEWLERTMGEEEVREAVECCARDKVPGPDGFTLAFFQH